MTFDKWFEKQSLLIKILLLLIPVVNWVTEVLVRLSVALRTKEILNIVYLVVYVVFGFFLGFVDLIAVIITGKLLFT